MRAILRQIHSLVQVAGFSPRRLIATVKGIPFYTRDYFRLKKDLKNSGFKIGELLPILDERFASNSSMDPAYFHQDFFVAQKVYKYNPQRHFDIGSRIDGFVAHLAIFREVEVFDIRPMSSPIENIIFRQADLTNLPEDLIDSCESLSSLHAIEHFGLGRYSDPIDVYGHVKAIDNIYKMMKPGGKFYFSVPVGKQRIVFNAHRVFAVSYLIKLLEGKFNIDSFSYVDDNGDFHPEVELREEDIKNTFDQLYYGCGIFELTCLK